MKFGFKDYIKMYRKRGLKLPIFYFFQNHFFDIWHQTETHTWLQKKDYVESPMNMKHGVLYMSSWTNIVKKSTSMIVKNFSTDADDCAFIDIGCGKGKVLCVWSRMFQKKSDRLLIGLDYSKSLLNICENNLKVISASNYKLINCDVTKISYDYGKKLNIYYLYNPFDYIILNKVVDKINQKKCYVIYNNPIHETVFIEKGFKIIEKKMGWHPNVNYIIFTN